MLFVVRRGFAFNIAAHHDALDRPARDQKLRTLGADFDRHDVVAHFADAAVDDADRGDAYQPFFSADSMSRTCLSRFFCGRMIMK